MIQHFKRTTIFLGLVFCLNHLTFAQSDADTLDFDGEDTNVRTQEIPIESIQRFVKIYALVKDNYVDPKTDDALFEQAIKGLVGGLDRYSRYLSPEDYQQLVQYTEGDVASTDFDLVFDNAQRQWVIKGLKDRSDSAKLGLKNTMIVYKLDNQDIGALNQEQVKNILYGSIGTVLSVQTAPVGQPLTVVRNKKVEVSVRYELLKNQTLIIKVPVFQQETASEIKNILENQDLTKVKEVLFDVRNNPGGLLSSAVETADLFLDSGVIVSTQSRSEGNQTFQALPSQDYQNIPIGILINHRSASAAEVFTAAMQEQNRAVVIGETSYGKGVVQKLFPLPNGAALQMTVAHYLTPKGHMIDGKGIQPNIEFAVPSGMKDGFYLEQVAELLIKKL